MRLSMPVLSLAPSHTQVIPYLLRRASENSSILTGSKKDLVMLKRELWRRGRAALGWPAADSAHAGAQAARPV